MLKRIGKWFRKTLKTDELHSSDSCVGVVIRDNKIHQIMTTDVPTLNIKEGQKIDVSISSTQADDEALLHHLLAQTRKEGNESSEK